MAGGTDRHNLIRMHIGRDLDQQMRQRPRRVYNSDIEVLASAVGLYTYPGVSVVLGESK